jgi:dipeptidyl aminopeptidase/acylaminoacyl peptidase
MKAQTRVGLFLAVLGLSLAAPPRSAAQDAGPAAPVAPDPPADSPRQKQLAKTAASILEAFGDFEPAFTRDGKRVVFASNRDGLPQLYVSDAEHPDSAAVRLATTKQRMTGPLPLADGKRLLFRSDTGADENWSFFVCNIDGSGMTELTPGAKRQRDGAFVPDGAPNTAFYSARAMSASGSEAYALELTAGAAEKKLYSDALPGSLADVSRDGKRALWVRFPSATDNTLLVLDVATGATRRIYPPESGPKVQVFDAKFSADGRRILVATDGGSEQALLLALDGNGRELARYKETRVPTAAIGGISVAKTGDRVALSLDAGNHNEVRLLDAKTLAAGAAVALPLGTGAIGDFSEDGRLLAGSWSTPDSPAEICSIEAATGRVTSLRRDPRPSLAGMPPVAASITEVPAFDGLKLPTNVYLPAVATEKKLPVLVVYHGGPSGSSAIRWSAAARFFTALGYAVVEPNVRGSGGFGRAFEMADNGPKRLDAFKDIETTSRWAASQPWADPTRMVVFGGSYGGYTVLIALERWPDVWRAGIDLFGVANMTTFLRSTSGVIREIFKLEFGDVDKDAAFLATISPIEQVDKIVDPLFVYAGANDPRVPRPESDQIVRALRDRKIPVEYMVADDEGHSLSRRENQIAFYSRAAAFLEAQMAAPAGK